mmetsp:Transcript_84254/g.168214  ORF Transcript_84254/g.168214 Transcript_84254/m.168214 type:complete len:226 (-) Transcript_84254:153-830(-)
MKSPGGAPGPPVPPARLRAEDLPAADEAEAFFCASYSLRHAANDSGVTGVQSALRVGGAWSAGSFRHDPSTSPFFCPSWPRLPPVLVPLAICSSSPACVMLLALSSAAIRAIISVCISISGALWPMSHSCAFSASAYTIAVPSSSSLAAASCRSPSHSATSSSVSAPRLTARKLSSGAASGYVGVYTTRIATDTWLVSSSAPGSGTSVTSNAVFGSSSSLLKSSP